jgi:hypothetical protein
MNGKPAYIAMQTGIPTLLWGRPGTGKTSWVKQVATRLNIPLEIVIASIREPSDFAGLPIITSEDDVKLSPPNWARRLAEVERGLLFLDELSTAPPAVQSAALRVVNERVIGDIYLRDSIWIVAAANPTETSSGTWTLSAALANRFIHLDWYIEPYAWVEGMLNGFKSDMKLYTLNENWVELLPHTYSIVASFIQAKPGALINEPENADLAGKAWASPRSWEMVAKILAACRSVNTDTDTEIILISGCVGNGAASEFLTWERNLDLPNPETLLAKPDKFVVPKRGDQTFAVLSAVVAAARHDLTKPRWNAAWKILGIAAEAGHADIAAIPAKTLALSREKNLPVPNDIKAFLPILQAAGLVG